MGVLNKIAQYKQYKRGVNHCTFNPEGPGVVRIHLIPPKFRLFSSDAYMLILNGYYLLPLGYSWAIVLSAFIDEVNKFNGKEITADDEKAIEKNTVKRVLHTYPFMSKEIITDDLYDVLDVIFTVASGKNPDIEIEKISLRAYKDSMSAPHRMDLMISSMIDENGKWNCNQKCVFCYAAGQCMGNSSELSTEQWKKVIDKLRNSQIPMLTFTGGEPTLRKDLTELVDYARWFVTRLNTNGVLLTKELCTELKEAGLDSIQITLYSCDKEKHNALVGSEHFEDMVNGIRNAVYSGLDISINTPLCRLNASYTQTLEFIKALGVCFVTVSGLICTGNAADKYTDADLTEDELFEIIKSAKAFCDKNGMEIDFTSPGLISQEKLESLGMNVPMCGAALSNMAICPDGTVVPCQSWLGSDAALGSVLSDDFNVIWNNEKCRMLRNMTEEKALLCPFRYKEMN